MSKSIEKYLTAVSTQIRRRDDRSTSRGFKILKNTFFYVQTLYRR